MARRANKVTAQSRVWRKRWRARSEARICEARRKARAKPSQLREARAVSQGAAVWCVRSWRGAHKERSAIEIRAGRARGAAWKERVVMAQAIPSRQMAPRAAATG